MEHHDIGIEQDGEKVDNIKTIRLILKNFGIIKYQRSI